MADAPDPLLTPLFAPQIAPLLARLIALEQNVHYQEPPSPGEPAFRHAAGRLPVLLSAPHGAVHKRHGQPKDEDEFTAGMARLLAERTEAHVLYVRRRLDGDPNADGGAGYKETLAQVVRQGQIGFVLDLHGSHQRHPFGLALGTIHGQSCPPAALQAILAALAQHGFHPQAADPFLRLDVDTTFPGKGSSTRETVTRFLNGLGVPAVQVEVNALLRIAERKPDASARDKTYRGDPQRIYQAVQALEAVVYALMSDLYEK